MTLEFRYRFEAAHRFLSSSSVNCMTPHGHTWFATMGVKFKSLNLNNNEMSVEFSEVKKDWRNLIQNTFDHSYMHNFKDPIIEVLKLNGGEPRLIPFPGDPTTELISLFLFQKMSLIINSSPYSQAIELDFITLEETPTNKVTCNKIFFETAIKAYHQYSGWWLKTDISDRTLHEQS
jgi:6-pyruvoyl-tetrahydropterin synthase